MLDPDQKGATGKSQEAGIVPARNVSRESAQGVIPGRSIEPQSQVQPIEQLARKSGLLPVKLPRSACPVDAEGILRKLGRMPKEEEPWMPVATLGPLLILGHYNPASSGTWGIPDFLCVRVVIEREAYLSISEDLRTRMSYKPLTSSGAVENLAAPAANSTPHSILDWFVCNYPLSAPEKEKWEVLVSELQGAAASLRDRFCIYAYTSGVF